MERVRRASNRRALGDHPFTIAHLASGCAAAGDADGARRTRDEVLTEADRGYVSSSLIAISELAAEEKN